MVSESLIEKAKTFFNLALQTPRGKKLVDSITWSRIVKFIVDDKPEFYLDIKRGRVEILPGDSPNNDFWEVSRVHTDIETLNRILEGRRDSVDAQYDDEAIKILPSGEYTQVCFVHQLCRFARDEILEQRIHEFEEVAPNEV